MAAVEKHIMHNSPFQKVHNALQSSYFHAWIIASVSGIGLYALMTFALSMGLGNPGIAQLSSTRLWLVYLLLGGLTMGVCQWVVLRRKFRQAYWWIVATTLGAMFSEIVMISLVRPLFDYLANPSIWRIAPLFETAIGSSLLFSLVYGLTVGLAQWLFLREHVQNAVGWVFAMVGVQLLVEGVTFVLPQVDALTLFSMDSSRQLILMAAGILNLVFIGVIWGFVTGVWLVDYVAQLDRPKLE